MVWCRDTESNWEYELVKGLFPNILKGLSFDISNLVQKNQIRSVEIFDPWKNEWSTLKKDNIILLPAFKRSVVVKIEKKHI